MKKSWTTKSAGKTKIHGVRKFLGVAVVFSALGGLAYGGLVTYRAYSLKSNSAMAIADSKQVQRDPTVHDFSDSDYASKMLLYHQLAAQLADIAKLRATRTEVRLFAEQYSAREAQQAGIYSNLLTSWNEPYLNITDFPEINGCNGYPTFSGMLPHSAVSAYRNSVGSEVDKLFLELTITHHQGLTALINENGRSIGYGELMQTQRSTLKSQVDEIERLNTMHSVIRT